MPSSDATATTRGMWNIALRLLLFLLPLLAGWAGLEVWMRQVPNSHSIKRENLARVAPDVDTLILGASSAYWDVSPELLPGSAYNLANVAQTPYYDDRLLTRWIDRLPRLHRVIISITYISLDFQLEGTDEEARQYYYNQVWGIAPPGLLNHLDIRMWSAVALQTPAVALDSLRVALLARLHGGPFAAAPLTPGIDARGWSPQPLGNPADLSAAVIQRKLDYHHSVMHPGNESDNIGALEHMLALLQARHIEVILITPPVWPGYAAGMSPELWGHTQSEIAALCAKYHARYLPFLLSPPFPAAYFLDADHLDRDGAVRFTRLLGATLIAQDH
jgi:hypothetical protein